MLEIRGTNESLTSYIQNRQVKVMAMDMGLREKETESRGICYAELYSTVFIWYFISQRCKHFGRDNRENIAFLSLAVYYDLLNQISEI